jgi:hypothetical protein
MSETTNHGAPSGFLPNPIVASAIYGANYRILCFLEAIERKDYSEAYQIGTDLGFDLTGWGFHNGLDEFKP